MKEDVIKEIQEKSDIVEVISSYLPLTKKGRNYFCLCPFHDDHSPSLCVSKEKQIFKCFVCGEAGNVFEFVMNYEHVNFYEAVEILGKKLGIEVVSNYKKHEHHENDKYYEIMDIANKFFQNNLLSKEGTLAREYLEKRKLDKETIKEFGIGLSLGKMDMLTNLLMNKGISLEELNLIDLSNQNHDTFINRIIFPLHNIDGRVMGFSGRIYDNSKLNKYQNTKETPIFRKRENLYNYHRAKEEIRKEKFVIVMEGFMAVIRSFTVGIKNCVATMGTALSSEQASFIKKLSNTVYLCYDGDDAGNKATLSSGEVFTKMGCNVFIVPLSEGLDPDDYILKYGDKSFKELIINAIPFNEYKIKSLKKNYNLSNVIDKTNYINNVLRELVNEKDEIKCEIILKNLAKDTDIWYNTLEKKLLQLKEKEKSVDKLGELKVIKEKKDGYNKAMDSLIFYSLNYTPAITLIDNSNVYIPKKEIRVLFNEILSFYNQHGEINESLCYTLLNEKEEKDLILVLKRILSQDFPSEIDDNKVNECLVAIKNYNIALKIKDLEKEIKEEVSLERQMKLMDEILVLKTKEGKSW